MLLADSIIILIKSTWPLIEHLDLRRS